MRSRSDQLRQAFLIKEEHFQFRRNLEELDFNGIITGTFDSILEDALRDNRDPGSPQPVVIENFVANSLMLNPGLFNQDRLHNAHLDAYLLSLRENERFGYDTHKKCELIKKIKDKKSRGIFYKEHPAGFRANNGDSQLLNGI